MNLLPVDQLRMAKLKLLDGAGDLASAFGQRLEKIGFEEAFVNHLRFKLNLRVAFTGSLVPVRALV